jgi:outer membrane lipoprotein
MIRKDSLLAVLAAIAMLFAGCAGGISSQARSQVTFRGPFSELLKRPEQYVGEIVLLGGRVLGTHTNRLFSEIGVLQLPLDWNSQPVDGDLSEGRFLVRSETFFDPEIYKKGELLSVVGQVSGSEVRPVGRYSLRYPIIRAIEIKRWPRWQAYYPSVRFSFGVGASF